jgi:signal transduction histidine kinase
MPERLRVLLFEDSVDDADLVVRALSEAGFAIEATRVDTSTDLETALRTGHWDLILSDYHVPPLHAPDVLRLVRRADPDVPIIVVSGAVGEPKAVGLMRGGAQDFVFKDRLYRLGPIVERELDAAAARREGRLAEGKLRDSRERLRVLSKRLLEAQEQERRVLARGLHDDVGQALTAVKLSLQALRRDTGQSPPLDEALAVVDRAIQQIRSLSLDLRPSLLDDLGLVPALRWYLDRQSQLAGFATRLTANERTCQGAPQEVETTCYRIVQEALTNAARHAQATHIDVTLACADGRWELIVHDDGVGFDVPAARRRAASGASLGLLSMEERATLAGGTLDITSKPGDGTTIRVQFLISQAPV